MCRKRYNYIPILGCTVIFFSTTVSLLLRSAVALVRRIESRVVITAFYGTFSRGSRKNWFFHVCLHACLAVYEGKSNTQMSPH